MCWVQRGQRVHNDLFLRKENRAWKIIDISLGDHCHNLDESEGMSWRKVTLGKEINTSQRQNSMTVVECDEKGTESRLDWSTIRCHVHLKIQRSQHHRLHSRAIFLMWMFIKRKITRIVLKKYNFCVNWRKGI